ARDPPSFPTRRSSDLREVSACRLHLQPSGDLAEAKVTRGCFRSDLPEAPGGAQVGGGAVEVEIGTGRARDPDLDGAAPVDRDRRSEEHTSELQSRFDL